MKKQGFTLIELMSVIVLLGLIVALVFPNVVDVVQKKQKEISESKLKIIYNGAKNYCIKNDIHIILCGGDLIDGSFSKGSQKISDLYQQIDYFIKNYPHDDSILTFGVAGDHDLSALGKFSINMM